VAWESDDWSADFNPPQDYLGENAVISAAIDQDANNALDRTWGEECLHINSSLLAPSLDMKQYLQRPTQYQRASSPTYMESSNIYRAYPTLEDIQRYPFTLQSLISAPFEVVLPSAPPLDIATEDHSPYCFADPSFDLNLSE